ncbi:MAG: hypothetical protein J07HR59_01380 [Halorubrum sp. J07HR59]|nr:MAG: hypothetical protein J07HR59_01380 [Halorubrum sp. J07HR59]
MIHGDAVSLLLGAVVLGAVHGVEPGHGWPVAASYALDQSNKWAYGLAASLILGVGHLISSIAMVGVFFYAKGYFNLTRVNEPIELLSPSGRGGYHLSWSRSRMWRRDTVYAVPSPPSHSTPKTIPTRLSCWGRCIQVGSTK